MSTIQMKSEEVIGYCEKAIAYWMADRKNQIDIAPQDACPEFHVMIWQWNHKEIKRAEDLMELAKLSSDTIDVGSDVLEIIETSKKTFEPREKDFWDIKSWDIKPTVDADKDAESNEKSESIDGVSWTGIKKLKNFFA